MQGYGKVYCASAVVLSCVSFDSGQCRRQSPLETHRLPQTDFREAFRRQGLYLERPIRTALYRWSSPCHSFKEESVKNALMLQHDKIMTRKRSLIETVNDQLKSVCQIEHTRHRCFSNFITNLLSALAAFSFFDKKPSINTAEEFVHPSFLPVA